MISAPYGDNGLANAVETTAESGRINYTHINSDGAALPDFLESDSAGDGCSDANEAYQDPDADNHFYGTGGPQTTDAKGRVIAAIYPVPYDGDGNSTMDYKEATAALEITVQPINTATCPGCNATISMTASNADTYQ